MGSLLAFHFLHHVIIGIQYIFSCTDTCELLSFVVRQSKLASDKRSETAIVMDTLICYTDSEYSFKFKALVGIYKMRHDIRSDIG